MRTDNLIFSIGDMGNQEEYEKTIEEHYKSAEEDIFEARYFDVTNMIEKLQHEKRILLEEYNIIPF